MLNKLGQKKYISYKHIRIIVEHEQNLVTSTLLTNVRLEDLFVISG